MRRTIALASGNPLKRAQLRWLLRGLPLAPYDPPAGAVDVEENGGSFAENARLKALACASATGGLAIASDGGLEVPGLAGRWDPLQTKRQGASLLQELLRETEDRTVLWREAVAVADNGRVVATWEGAPTTGLILTEPRGPAGALWVWRLFLFPAIGKAWAEASDEELEQQERTWRSLRAEAERFFRR